MYFRITSTLKSSYICLLSALIFCGVFSGVFSGGSSVSWAQSVSSNSSLNFGLIEFDSNHAGELTLGTNGGVSLTGTGLFYQGNAVPGQITLGDITGNVEIRCDATSIMAGTSGGSSLNVSNIEAAVSIGVSAGSGNACQGVAGADPAAVVISLDSNPNAHVLFGGKLTIPSGALNGGKTYSSSAASGSPLTISIVFQ